MPIWSPTSLIMISRKPLYLGFIEHVLSLLLPCLACKMHPFGKQQHMWEAKRKWRHFCKNSQIISLKFSSKLDMSVLPFSNVWCLGQANRFVQIPNDIYLKTREYLIFDTVHTGPGTIPYSPYIQGYPYADAMPNLHGKSAIKLGNVLFYLLFKFKLRRKEL